MSIAPGSAPYIGSKLIGSSIAGLIEQVVESHACSHHRAHLVEVNRSHHTLSTRRLPQTGHQGHLFQTFQRCFRFEMTYKHKCLSLHIIAQGSTIAASALSTDAASNQRLGHTRSSEFPRMAGCNTYVRPCLVRLCGCYPKALISPNAMNFLQLWPQRMTSVN